MRILAITQQSPVWPSWWNALHDQALAMLTADWQRIAAIRGELQFVAFEDLVVAGVAVIERRPLTSATGHPAGEAVYVRAARKAA